MREQSDLKKIFNKYLENKCTPEEAEWLLKELAERKLNGVDELVLNQIKRDVSPFLIDKQVRETLQERLKLILDEKPELKEGKEKKAPLKYIAMPKVWYAAAALVVGLTISAYLILNSGNEKALKGQVRVYHSTVSPAANPGGERAVLIMADGKVIDLSAAAPGVLSHDGDARIMLKAGQLSYDRINNDNQVSQEPPRYNTIKTPLGGTFLVHLSDGSKVWLNAGSSLRFPEEFKGDTREVELTGEGYFEVAHNAQQPFKVNVDGMKVTVLGTHFNINAYGDYEGVATTLVEGSVRVSVDNKEVLLSPREQVTVKGTMLSPVKTNVNVGQIIAWKDGNFDFEQESMATIGRQLSRWYQVRISVNPNLSEKHISGVISRNNNLDAILKMLEFTIGIKSKWEGDSILLYKN